MNRLITSLLACLFLLVAASGCATLADARAAKGTGMSKTFNADSETVWKTLPGVANSIGLSVVADNKAEGYMLAQRGITLMSYGENVAIFVESVGRNRTKVEVVSKRAMATNIFAPDWAPELLEKLEVALAR
jgi:hypothetical protein